jgi:hypothetical protein
LVWDGSLSFSFFYFYLLIIVDGLDAAKKGLNRVKLTDVGEASESSDGEYLPVNEKSGRISFSFSYCLCLNVILMTGV